MIRSSRNQRLTLALLFSLSISIAIAPLSYDPAYANLGDPCAKYPKGSKNWKKCKKIRYKPGAQLSTDDERFMAGYWLAKNGHYQQALDILTKISSRNDPRVLNYIGYATRKLGRTNEALVYYAKAIKLAPDYVVSRAYMGEAFLATGDKASARHQLRQIAQRCGTSCQSYLSLKENIENAM